MKTVYREKRDLKRFFCAQASRRDSGGKAWTGGFKAKSGAKAARDQNSPPPASCFCLQSFVKINRARRGNGAWFRNCKFCVKWRESEKIEKYLENLELFPDGNFKKANEIELCRKSFEKGLDNRGRMWFNLHRHVNL